MDCVTGGEVMGVLVRVAVIACIAVLIMFLIDEVAEPWVRSDDKDHREWYK